jgi:hypothetical protein
MTQGLILNYHDDRLPPDSPWRTRHEVRHQPPVFVLEDDGYPVYEVWYWHDELSRWFVMSRVYNARLAAMGVIFFFGIEQLKAWIAHLYAEKAQQRA